MPRDSQGSYNLPSGSLVNSGDTILPSQHNPPLEDISSALTGSLSRDGLGGMRAPLNVGGYRVTNMADGASDTDAATVAQLFALAVPIGAVIDYAGFDAPSGYLLCAGQAVSRTDYAALYANIGVVYGAGDGSTTFNVPDLRGNVVAGKGDMGGIPANRLTSETIGGGGGPDTLGGYGGDDQVTLTIDQIPAHSHGVTDPGHTHAYAEVSGSGGIASGVGLGQFTAGTSTSTTGISIANAGGGVAHNNVQPTFILNKIIRAL